jgi:MFS family permease
VIVAWLVVFATAPFLYLPVTDSWQLMAVRFYHGFATAIFNTVATAAIAAQYPQRRAAMLSTYSSITNAGRSIAPFRGRFLISLANFQSVYWACAISGVLAFIVALMLPRRVHATTHGRALPAVFRGAARRAIEARHHAHQHCRSGAVPGVRRGRGVSRAAIARKD